MHDILEAIADRMVAAEEKGFTTADLRTADGIVTYVATLPPHMQKDIRLLITLFQYLPLLIIFKPRRFTSLSPRDQDRYIRKWGASRFGVLRTGFRVLKSLCVSAYYQSPGAWNAIGYER